ncbi:UPF0764 protein C16orf89 homolog isoform X2 [Ostrea edulis]|uniref:UPF0764 protein C16orf89 homolog isoform X2 n=1 Tax=Ostrea edulis TaxID=37623 RepID=UPI0024AEA558|nr:UPF0764 protein C16orf89 homolog isoform X2 [Ostrea edulis]
MIGTLVVALCVFGASGLLVDSGDDLFGKVLYNLEKQIDFFASDYSDINVDGLFGLRMAQGQMTSAVERCHESSACSSQYLSKLKNMESKIGDTSDKALPYVKQSDPAYYERFLQTIGKAWILPYIPVQFKETDLRSVTLGTNSSYNEDYGDACYARVMGTFNSVPRCTVTPECWNFMTSDDTSHYAITHQLLYFIVIEHVGCLEQVEKNLHGHKVRDVQTRMCKRIYKEAENLISKGGIKSFNRDLFLEQTVLCGPLGYENFMRRDWMEMTLRWLDTHFGCFRMTLPELEKLTDEMVNDVFKNRNISAATIKKYKIQAEQESKESFEKEQEKLLGSTSSPTMRKLMREKGMKGDWCILCLSHLLYLRCKDCKYKHDIQTFISLYKYYTVYTCV